MGTAGLHLALSRGAPLVDVTVKFVDGVDSISATNRINTACEDFDLYPKPYYDDPQLRTGSATKEALERLFRWRLKRVPLERFDDATKTWGHWTDAYRWEEMNKPDLHGSDWANVIASIGISGPGADDDGQWWE